MAPFRVDGAVSEELMKVLSCGAAISPGVCWTAVWFSDTRLSHHVSATVALTSRIAADRPCARVSI